MKNKLNLVKQILFMYLKIPLVCEPTIMHSVWYTIQNVCRPPDMDVSEQRVYICSLYRKKKQPVLFSIFKYFCLLE